MEGTTTGLAALGETFVFLDYFKAVLDRRKRGKDSLSAGRGAVAGAAGRAGQG